MEKQLSFTDIEYAGRKRTTKREEFLKKNGRDHTMEKMDRNHPAVLSRWKKRSSCTRNRNHAEDVSDADMV